jgi:TetR/AcrR family transcriptional regulator, copper-responsive repressor
MRVERGRPRGFDVEKALEQAMSVFWRHGFLNASLTELTTAMGLNKPSLYAAFGDKESLYLKALDRYVKHYILDRLALLETGDKRRDAFENFLRALAAMYVDATLPGGCFIINGASDGGGELLPKSIEVGLSEAMKTSEDRLRATLILAQNEGSLRKLAFPQETAAFYMSVIVGMGLLAKNGSNLDRLNGIIKIAMNAWNEVPQLQSKNEQKTKRS